MVRKRFVPRTYTIYNLHLFTIWFLISVIVLSLACAIVVYIYSDEKPLKQGEKV